MNTQIKLINPDVVTTVPAYKSIDAAGADISYPGPDPITLEPNQTVLIKTNFAIQLPPNYQAEIRGRSGLALKHQIQVLNSPGTIDRDYTGEICVILHNHSNTIPYTVQPNDRIAQLVVMPYVQTSFAYTTSFDEITTRGNKGFGSSGK